MGKSICVCFFILAKGRSVNLKHHKSIKGFGELNVFYLSLDYFVIGDVNDFGLILIVIVNVPTRIVGCFNLLLFYLNVSSIDDDSPRKV